MQPVDDAEPLPLPPPPLVPRPRGPRVLGILSIVFGGSEIMVGRPHHWTNRPPSGAAAQAFAQLERLDFRIGLALVAMSLWLIGVGIGQLRYRRWAAAQTISWSVVALAVLGALVVVQLQIVAPIAARVFDGQGQTAWASGWITGVMLVGLVLTLAPYPIVLLAYFGRARARAALSN